MRIIDPMQNNLPFSSVETIEKLKVIQNLPANLFFFLNKQIDFCILGVIHKCHSNTVFKNEYHTPSNKHYWNTHFERAKPILNQSPDYLERMLVARFRSFQKALLVSVGQRAAKPLAVKGQGLKKILPPGCTWNTYVRSRQLDHPQSLTDSNFTALWAKEAQSTSFERSWSCC